MRKLHLLSTLCALVVHSVVSLEYPATLELDIVFPRNETYNHDGQSQLPIVFAVQGAEAYFDWQVSISWRVSLLGTTIGPQIVAINSGVPNDGVAPPDVRDDVWWVSSQTRNTTVLAAGDYMFEWAMTASGCYRINNGNTLHIGKVASLGSGTINFTLVDDGSGEDVGLTDGCPIYGDRAVADVARKTDTCPDFDNVDEGILTETRPNPCRGRVSDDMSTCIMGNLTGNFNDDSCSRIKAGSDRKGGKKGDGNGEKEDGEAGNEGNEDTRANEDDSDHASNLSLPSGLLLVLGALFAQYIGL